MVRRCRVVDVRGILLFSGLLYAWLATGAVLRIPRPGWRSRVHSRMGALGNRGVWFGTEVRKTGTGNTNVQAGYKVGEH